MSQALQRRGAEAPAARGDAPLLGWDELADACHVDRRTLTNARTNFGKEIKALTPADRAEIIAGLEVNGYKILQAV